MSLSQSARIFILLFAGLLAACQAFGKTYKVLYSFTGQADGLGPAGSLVCDAAGNLYGTTNQGGAHNFGTVFKFDTSGTESVLYSFAGGKDGAYPDAELILDSTGNLYGTTERGGGSNACPLGCGTLFRVSSQGNETVLHRFSGKDGAWPVAGLVRDASGSLYGTTEAGGGSSSCDHGCGTVFKLTKHTLTVLHAFTGGNDGAIPLAILTIDAAGNLYGTTVEGGTANSGIAFKIDTTGGETILHNFGFNDLPESSLILDSSGNLYGTDIGGGNLDAGSIFTLDSSGQETVLYSFKAVRHQITYPRNLVRDSSGNIYGITVQGGGQRKGTIFRLDSSGQFAVLHRFTGGTSGEEPSEGLIFDSNGNLVGTAGGGQYGFGIIYRLTP